MKGKEENTKGSEQKLTKRQELFVTQYLANGGNGAAAARDAGYSEHTARQIATENLAKPYVASAIRAKRSEIMRDTESKVDWLIERLTAEATDAENGESTRVRALEILGKVYGAYAPEKQEITQYSGTFLADLDLEEGEEPLEIRDLH